MGGCVRVWCEGRGKGGGGSSVMRESRSQSESSVLGLVKASRAQMPEGQGQEGRWSRS